MHKSSDFKARQDVREVQVSIESRAIFPRLQECPIHDS
jgi:hypothetical protein